MQYIILWLYSCIYLDVQKQTCLKLISQSDKQEETAMLKTDDIDFPLEVVMETRETYPEEVLISEWNPVIAQLQLLKGYGRVKKQSGNPLRLAVPEMDLPVRKD
jgi:hypothetical protein